MKFFLLALTMFFGLHAFADTRIECFYPNKDLRFTIKPNFPVQNLVVKMSNHNSSITMKETWTGCFMSDICFEAKDSKYSYFFHIREHNWQSMFGMDARMKNLSNGQDEVFYITCQRYGF